MKLYIVTCSKVDYLDYDQYITSFNIVGCFPTKERAGEVAEEHKLHHLNTTQVSIVERHTNKVYHNETM